MNDEINCENCDIRHTSDCCNAEIIHSDICSQCGEHCDDVCDDCDLGGIRTFKSE